MLKRIISRLDIKNNTLVKGVHLEGLRVLGSPKHFMNTYYNEGIDEIYYQDIVASLYKRNTMTDILAYSVENIFIPISVGGGVNSLNYIEKLLSSGADKVSINTAAVKDPKFINLAVKEFGSSTINVTIEVIKSLKSKSYEILIESGREKTGLELKQWIKKIQDSGVGEITITSIDKEGTKKGYDLELIEYIDKVIEIPLLIHGGCGAYSDAYHALSFDKISGIIISGALHYSNIVKDNINLNLGRNHYMNNFQSNNNNHFSVVDLKKYLKKKGIEVRI